MSVIDKLRKRRFYPVQIDGDTIHIRALLDSEINAVTLFRDEEESYGFAIGCSLLNPDGSSVFARSTDETDKAFGRRVLDELDLPTDTKAEISGKILKLSNGPLKDDDLKKN